MRKETINMEKKDFKKGQKAILLSLKNVDFRKTMDIDAATEECTVVKVGRKYITVEDSHGWEIHFPTLEANCIYQKKMPKKF